MRRIAFAAGALALAACSSGTQEGAPGPRPAVEAGRADPAAETPPSDGRGREISYKAAPRAHYRLERFDTVLVQLPDNTTQSQIFTRTAWLTAATVEGDSGLRATVVLDSLEMGGMMQQAAAAALDSARGTRWTANVAPNGRLSSVSADRKSLVGEQVGSLLQLLFPILPGESIRSGASWTDTTDASSKVDMFDVRERAITQHMALSATVRGAGTALPIQANGSFTHSGTAMQGGQQLEIESTGNRRFTYYLGLDGVPSGLEGSETSEVTVTVPAVGQSIRATRSAGVRGDAAADSLTPAVRLIRRVVAGSVAATALLVLWLFAVWPPPVWYRTHFPSGTAFMRMRATESPGLHGSTPTPRFDPVPLDSISPHFARAVLTGEDHRFWTHGGIDFVELRRALGYRRPSFSWFSARDGAELLRASAHGWERRDAIRGASTITQQLAKNLYLSPSRNPLRKVKEAVTAYRLEAALGKRRILELYANVVELGPDVWGVGAASRHYYGRPAARLSRSQAAALAATLPFPRLSNPASRPGRMRWRQNLILRRMRGELIEVPRAEEPAADPLPPAPASDSLQGPVEIEMDTGSP